MSKRKDPGAPWSPLAGPNSLSRGKVHSGGPALSPTTYQSRYLDPHVAARHHRERLTEKLSKFANAELTPVQKRRGLPQ